MAVCPAISEPGRHGGPGPRPAVGHANIRYVEIDTPVTVGSLVVHPGDLIHGDEHGVMVVPKEISLEKLIAFVSEFLASEKTIVDYCKQPDFNIDKLGEVVDGHENRTTRHF
jgi:regulator of RNase E activity RraA